MGKTFDGGQCGFPEAQDASGRRLASLPPRSRWAYNRIIHRLLMNTEIIGIDHIYLAVSDIGRSETFYDRLMPVLGFRKNTFMNEAEQHIQYYTRHFGLVLRPAHNLQRTHEPLGPG